MIEKAGSFIPSVITILRTSLTVAVIAVLLLVTLTTYVFAGDQKSNLSRCDLTEDEVAGLNSDPGTNLRGIENYASAVRSMLAKKEFDKLDCVADVIRSGKERFPGGSWKIHIFYLGLASPAQYPLHATGEDWETLINQLRDWVSARPESVTSHVALGSAYLQYAWQARGSGYANSVSDSGWKLFHDRTADGKRILEEASTLPTKCPEWYLAMQTVAQNESWSADQARALFEKAFRFEPGYYYYAQMFANYLLPKWSGDKGDTERFAGEIANRVGGDQGNFLYFRMARYMLCECDDDNPELSWPRIAKGYEAMDKLYGASMEDLNWIASFAAQKGDAIVANNAMARIGDQWDPKRWKNKAEFDSWNKWAAGYAAVLAKRIEQETMAAANSQTPEGRRYKASFESTYKNIVRECTKTESSNSERFETLTCIGEHGTVEDIKIYWTSPAAVCVYQKLRDFQVSKVTPFSPPPKTPYWIRLDFDGSEFSAAAGQ